MEIQQLRISLTHALRQLLHRLQLDLEILRRALHRASPRAKITDGRQRLDVFARRVQSASLHTLALKRKALDGLQQTLRVVGPASVLSRGFAVVQRADTGAIVRSVGQVFSGDALDVRVSDGSFGAKVTSEDQSQER
jgi:exodeoxyribonuclease VII large subunit